MSGDVEAGLSAARRPRAVGARGLDFRAHAYLFAAVALSWTLRVTVWHANDDSFQLAAGCFFFLLLGTVVSSSHTMELAMRPVVVPLLAAAMTFYMWCLFGYGPNVPPYSPLVSAAAVLIGLGLAGNRSLERWRIPFLLGVHFWLGVWRITTNPTPHIDVWVWHNEAIQALFDGHNPYAITMPNIYPDARFYDPTLVAGDRVLTGYQYPPLSLLFAIPGYLYADYRYSQLFAMTVCGACLAYSRLGTFGATAMAMWLFSPGCLFVLEHGYTEPMLGMFLALTLLCAIRWPRWVFIPLGLLFSAKQYMLLIAAPMILLLPDETCPKGRWRLFAYAVGVATVVNLPFFVINPKAFFDCLVLLQIRQPFRTESLSLPAWWFAKHNGQRLPDWMGFASLIPMSALAIWRSERSASAFAAGVALISFTFFVLSKQAFGNYYFFTLSAICGAAAYSGLRPARTGRLAERPVSLPADRMLGHRVRPTGDA